MANEEHLARLKQGVAAWNQWRDENRGIQPDLGKADLSGAYLSGVHLGGDSWGAPLGGFREADIGWTTFGDVDLSAVHGLETVHHRWPSTIGIDTLYRSHGNIQEVFLRGAGVSEDMITYMKSLVGRPFEFYSCFISYSSHDDALAQRLLADLQNKGVRCWFAPEDLKIGDEFRSRIDGRPLNILCPGWSASAYSWRHAAGYATDEREVLSTLARGLLMAASGMWLGPVERPTVAAPEAGPPTRPPGGA